jgi:hypothetical protein
MTNGNGATLEAEPAPPVSVEFDLSSMTYGDMRRLQTMDASTPAGQAVLDTVLEKAVIGGIDAIPLRELRAVVVALMAHIAEEMSAKNAQAAP